LLRVRYYGPTPTGGHCVVSDLISVSFAVHEKITSPKFALFPICRWQNPLSIWLEVSQYPNLTMIDSSTRLPNLAGMGKVMVGIMSRRFNLLFDSIYHIETGTSAGLKRPLSPSVSEYGPPYPRTICAPRIPRPRPELYKKVSEWRQMVATPNTLSPERSPSPFMSESNWSSSSESTVVDHALNGGYCGDWLTLPSPED
jgi:hypothetical protein